MKETIIIAKKSISIIMALMMISSLFIAAIPMAIASDPAAHIFIESGEVLPNETINLTIWAHNITNLHSWGVRIYFDPTVVKPIAGVHNPVFTTPGFGAVDIWEDHVFASVMNGRRTGENETVWMANITFRAIGDPGEESILRVCTQMGILDPLVDDIPHTTSNGTVTILAEEPPVEPANFTFSNLTVSPITGVAPLNITATALVTNIGGEEGEFNAKFVIDGDVVDYEIGTLDARENTTVEFTYTFEIAGTFNVTINELPPVTVTVTVRPPVEPPVTAGTAFNEFPAVAGVSRSALLGQDIRITNLAANSIVVFTGVGGAADGHLFTVTANAAGVADIDMIARGMRTGRYNITGNIIGVGVRSFDLFVDYPTLILRVELAGTDTAVTSVAQGTHVEIDIATNINPADRGDIRLTGPDGLAWRVNPADGALLRNLSFSVIDTFIINTTGWAVGTWTIEVRTFEYRAQGLDIRSNVVNLTIVEDNIIISVTDDTINVNEITAFTVTAPARRWINIIVDTANVILIPHAGDIAARGNVTNRLVFRANNSFDIFIRDDGTFVFAMKFTEDGIYTVTAMDPITREEVDIDITVGEVVPPVAPLMIHLQPGWNLISTPITLNHTNNSIGEIMVGLNWSTAFTFCGRTQNWSVLNRNSTLTPLNAVFIYMEEEGIITLTPSEELTSPPSKNVFRGWNLISLANLESMCVGRALVSIVVAEGDLIGYTIVVSPPFNPESWIFTRYDYLYVHHMQPTKGYWVFMENSDILAGFTMTPLE